MPCPTVRVKDANSPDGYIIINESDLTDRHEVIQPEHSIFSPEVIRDSGSGLLEDHVAKSIAQPIGQPTVMDNTDEGRFARQSSVAPGQTVVLPGGTEIPDNWEDMHWKKQVKLARSLGLQDFGREISGDKAKAFIRLKVAERDSK